VRSLDELRSLVEAYLGALTFGEDLNGLEASMRYALEGGGKRIRPVLCLATAEAAGAQAEAALPAAAAIELVHTFSLAHDDLPALDDDDVRRGRPSTHVEFSEAVAILAGDALLAQALDLALSYPTTDVARELAAATLGMIGGQYLDVTGDEADLERLNALKTGRLFAACVGCGLWVAGVPEERQEAWRAFGAEVGPLFQAVDDVLDRDGLVLARGEDEARRVAAGAEERAQAWLADIPADTSRLAELVSGLSTRLPAS
jgi:geranylgeranyl diphosphate synthase, type II